MIVAQRDDLVAVKTLINNSSVRLVLFENSDGNLFLSSDSSTPQGTVYYATVPSLLCMFLENQIDLQTLFNNTPSLFVEITTKDKSSLYSRKNIKIELTSGDKTIKGLTTECPIEIW
jgi:hypothetical protein